jgi:hypothetical protein
MLLLAIFTLLLPLFAVVLFDILTYDKMVHSKTGVYHLGIGVYVVRRPWLMRHIPILKLHVCPDNSFKVTYYLGYSFMNVGLVYSNQWERP